MASPRARGHARGRVVFRLQEARMATSDAGSSRKTYVVDTSILVSAPDAIQNLTTNNTVVVPFPVLQELDRRAHLGQRRRLHGAQHGQVPRRAPGRGIDRADAGRHPAQRRHAEVPQRHARHGAAPGPGSTPTTPTMRSSCWPTTTSRSTPTSRSSSSRATRPCAARRARASVTAEDYWSDRPVPSLEKFYSGRVRIEVPEEQAGLLSTLHHEQRLPVDGAQRASPT